MRAPTDERRLRAEVTKVAQALHRMGWVANHDGNVTARLGGDRFLATPTGVSKADVTDSMLIVVDSQGKLVSGTLKPFSELPLHLAAYAARSDANAVVHAHPPVATAFGVAGRGLDRPFLPEAVVSLGAKIPLVPLALPGTPAFGQSVRDHVVEYDALLLEGNGALTVGTDLEQAYLRMELLEHLARIAWHAEALGGPRYLAAEHVGALLEKRRQAELGSAARAGAGLGGQRSAEPDTRGGVAPAAAVSGSPSRTAAPPAARADADLLRRIVTDELKKVLSRRE